jgi:hypothetical protein
MTDRRATDHTYGHLGEATYDTIEKKWTFSRIPVLRMLPKSIYDVYLPLLTIPQQA